MKKTGLFSFLVAAASVALAVGQNLLPSVKAIPGSEAMEKALKLPHRVGMFDRGLPSWRTEPPTRFKVDDMDRYPRYTRAHTAADNPPSNMQVEYTTYYAAKDSYIKLMVTLADHPEVLMDLDHPDRTMQMGRATPGSFTGRKLLGQSWHVGELGKAAGVCYLVLRSGNAQVFADLQMNSIENGKDVMHTGPTEEQARDVESLAETALKNAVAYRVHRYL